MKQTPILFYGDSADLRTGLARIGRDLAVHCCTLPEFRVGYLGRGGTGSRQLPFVQYNFPAEHQWGEAHIARVWSDFAENERGVIFTIWDASRLGWFANPMAMALPTDLDRFLASGQFERWGYFPVDSTGPRDRLTVASCETLRRYDRVLGYGAWGAGVLERSLGRDRSVDWIPHGLNMDVWQPRDRTAARMASGFAKEDTVIGCLMSNQTRKDWGLACAIARELTDCKFWFHVDALVRDWRWDLRALIADTDIASRIQVTVGDWLSDDELSYRYSACDLTMLPSLGEGFGFSIVESLACGVPCIHGNYGGGVELVPQASWLVEPAAWRLESLQCCVRPVYRPEDWVEVIRGALDEKASADFCRESVEHLSWKNLWPAAWRKFFLEGLA
jgi:glycosyltransferase involved in cell wall biosynthesis